MLARIDASWRDPRSSNRLSAAGFFNALRKRLREVRMCVGTSYEGAARLREARAAAEEPLSCCAE